MNPRQWICPEEGSVGTGINVAYTQSLFLPSILQMADVYQVPGNFLMLPS